MLIVDDDVALRASLRRVLSYEGHQVHEASDGQQALHEIRSICPDLVVLDLMLPRIDGFEVCRLVRMEQDVPILMLTARDGLRDRVTGLDSGADDYLSKPFALEELLARTRALLRRTGHGSDLQLLQVGDLIVDERSMTVTRAQRPIELTSREWDLLRFLARHAGEVLPRQRIVGAVWDYTADSNVLEVYIRYLRNKLEAGGESRMIHNLRGRGYILRADPPGAAEG